MLPRPYLLPSIAPFVGIVGIQKFVGKVLLRMMESILICFHGSINQFLEAR